MTKTYKVDLRIINYHYVRNIKRSKYKNIRGLEFEDFKEQIYYLKKKYNIISIDTLLNNDFNNKKNLLLLTFDDGYLDHFIYVYPFLKKEKIQGSFFAPVNSILHKDILDVNKLHFIFNAENNSYKIYKKVISALKEFDLDVNKFLKRQVELKKKYDLRFNDKYTNLVRNFLQYILPSKVRKNILDRLFSEFVTNDKEIFLRELYLNKFHAQEMIKNDMHFGSHGKTHEWLEYLSPDSQFDELYSSKKLLLELGVNKEKLTISYPFGSYNKSTLKICKKLNYKIGFANEAKKISDYYSNVLKLPRYDTNDFKIST
jgi:peptidoglycan/xylan/chitin deacetylase (PgdA/CDA1 family)